jgi:electron transport complex protein RnfG
MTIGVAPDGTVAGLAISMLDQTETPGLGVKVTLAAFRDQFRGKGAEGVRLKKDGGTIDAITAATISSRAVVYGVREALAWYRKAFPRGLEGASGG